LFVYYIVESIRIRKERLVTGEMPVILCKHMILEEVLNAECIRKEILLPTSSECCYSIMYSMYGVENYRIPNRKVEGRH
jgi:hypothetical protein